MSWRSECNFQDNQKEPTRWQLITMQQLTQHQPLKATINQVMRRIGNKKNKPHVLR